jgi:RNA polymerase sigma-70 factor, ECF subfamily
MHGDAMWRFALPRVRNAAAAEDLIQESLLAAFRGQAGFRGESSERTWLLSILRHKIADYRRRQAGFPVTGAEIDPATDVLDTMFDTRGKWKIDPGRWPRDPEGVLDRPEFWADLERCISLLPGGLAEAFILREVRSQTAEAICEALAITAQNLWVRLHRARALLRQCLSRNWAKGGRR